MFNVSCVSLARESCYRPMKCRAILVSKTGWPYRGISSEAGAVLSMRKRKLRTISARNRRAHPARVVARLGVLSWRGDTGRPGDKYPFDIMDGVRVQPQRNGGTNPIRFANDSVGAAHMRNIDCKSVSSKLILAINLYSLWRLTGVVRVHT